MERQEADKRELEQRQVPVDRLTAVFGCDTLDFNDTSELEPLKDGIVGQERAVQAMDFGLGIKHFGYNLYLSGPTGTGKTSYAASKVREIAKNEPTPGDICYVYNFEQPDFPHVLEFNAGEAAVFKKEMEELIQELKTEIRKSFESDDYEERHTQIRRKWETQINNLWYGMENGAMKQGFSVQKSTTGIFTVPLDEEGKPIPREDFLKLPEETQAQINLLAQDVQGEVNDALRKIRAMEKDMRVELDNVERETGLYAAGFLVNQMKEEYREYPKVADYLDEVLDDIIDNLTDFLMDGEEELAPEMQMLQMPQMQKQNPSQKPDKYKVNVFVDNGKTEGAPVIVEDNPTYYNLLGRVDYRSSLGVMVTDFNMIKAGSLHLANGGYLIIQAIDLFSNAMIWPAFKRALKTGLARIENIGEHVSMVSVVTLKPEPIEINVKVVLIGNPRLFHQLYSLDEDFKKLFKVKVDFDQVMPRDEKQLSDYTSFVCSFCNDTGNRHLDCEAVALLLEYGSRIVSHQEKLTTRFNEVINIIVEGNYWAAENNHSVITVEDIQKALDEKVYRSNLIEEKIQESIEEDSLVLDLEGFAVGQANGLAVLQVGDYAFGRPSRITARTSMGQKGILNIEREVKISGASHSKGILILSGYLSGKFARKKPLSLNASITFEQLYDGVDGDSASSTELYALLSDLSGVPLNQGIAITGSVNQYGEIQPIGGVNQKIEGFYHACKNRGLTGSQGVMIPKRNVKNLVLKREVIKAVEEGKFQIWAVETIDEGIEVLSGVAAGEKSSDGSYPEGTINSMVDLRLKEMAEDIRKFGRKNSDDADSASFNEAAVSED